MMVWDVANTTAIGGALKGMILDAQGAKHRASG